MRSMAVWAVGILAAAALHAAPSKAPLSVEEIASRNAAAIESARGPAAAGQIPLTRNEIAHLLAAVTAPPGRDAGHRLRWSHWRRRHQHRARTCHYQRQITQDHAT